MGLGSVGVWSGVSTLGTTGVSSGCSGISMSSESGFSEVIMGVSTMVRPVSSLPVVVEP